MKKWILLLTLITLFTVACGGAAETAMQVEPMAELEKEAAEEGALAVVTPSDADEASEPLLSDSETAEESKEKSEGSDNPAALSKEDMETAVLIYERRGGMKGIGSSVQKWYFFADGRIVSEDGNSWQVEPEAIDNLMSDVTTSGFKSLESAYVPDDPCCDRATHIITVQENGQTYTVETLDDAEMPASLENNLEAINELLMGLYE
jgi:hypothetical protein